MSPWTSGTNVTKMPTFHGMKYVGLAPVGVTGGPGLCEHKSLRDNFRRAADNGYSYHIRFAVIIPAFPAVSHIYTCVSPETRVDDSRYSQVHPTTTTDPTSPQT